MEAQEQAVHNHPAKDFKYNVGRFWKMFETRAYMECRLDYRAALTFVRNVESVQAQLDTVMENLRLCRDGKIGSRDVAPGLMIRLDKDQESYDFLKWWATSAKNPQYDWNDITLPFLDIKDANPLEPVWPFLNNTNELSHVVVVTLIKIKLYFILLTKHGANEASTDKLRKAADEMMALKNSTIARNPNVAVLSPYGTSLELDNIKGQIRQLYDAVHNANPHFWAELIDPDEKLSAAPAVYSSGSKEEMQTTIMWTWQAWNETFGALEIIYGIVKGQQDAFSF